MLVFVSDARPEVLLEDLSSKYGTFLNGAILNPKTSVDDVKRQENSENKSIIFANLKIQAFCQVLQVF